jgi:pyruvate dehydrogenase (quinone)/pyruvate oxidase
MLIGELATCVKYGLNVKIVVIKNNTLGQIKWEQMVFLGNPEYACDLQPVDFAAIARGFGVEAYTVDDPAQCGEVLRQALATRGPALVEAVVDPNEPPMPPKVSLKEAAHLAESLARGTPAAGEIAKTIAANAVRELV